MWHAGMSRSLRAHTRHIARRFCARSDSDHLEALQATLPAAYAASFEQFRPVWEAVVGAAEAGAAVSGEPTTILDLASAQGEPACSLARRFPRAQVVATDNEPAMVAASTERGQQLGLGPRYSAQEADLRQLASLAGLSPADVGLQTDLVSASLALHMLPPDEIGGCLRGIYALLRPGGRLVATVWEDELALLPLGRACLARILGRRVDELPPLEPHSPISLGGGRADPLLKAAGFEPGPQHNRILSFSLKLGFKGADSTWMLGLMPCLGALHNIATASAEARAGGVFERARRAFEAEATADANGDVVVGPMRVRVLAAVKPAAG
jgi:SAM-dependent methyltransferase